MFVARSPSTFVLATSSLGVRSAHRHCITRKLRYKGKQTVISVKNIPRIRISVATKDAATSTSIHSPEELRFLWDSVKKPLLTVGKSGLTAQHVRSLSELVSCHTLVKVKLTQGVTPEIETAAVKIAEDAGCSLLQVKGSTLLFTSDSAALPDLRLVAAANIEAAEKTSKQRRATKSGTEPPLVMDVSVRAKLASLIDRGTFKVEEIDEKAQRSLASLPPEAALGLLNSFTRMDVKKVRNKSAWLTSQCSKCALDWQQQQQKQQHQSESLSQTGGSVEPSSA